MKLRGIKSRNLKLLLNAVLDIETTKVGDIYDCLKWVSVTDLQCAQKGLSKVALQLSISLHILSVRSQRLPLAYQTLNDAKLKLISTLAILQQTVVNSIIFELSCDYSTYISTFAFFNVRLNMLVEMGYNSNYDISFWSLVSAQNNPAVTVGISRKIKTSWF